MAIDDAALTATLQRLAARGRFGIRPGLSRTEELLHRLGDPHNGLRGVLVAGTNGKGSVCATLDSMSRAAGRRTVLLAKPHLVSWGERIVIDGVPLDDDAFCALAAEVLDVAETIADRPTQFEVLTAMGILAAARHDIETLVCEVGMGGRLDSTNVLDLGVAALTNVALDHQSWLGDTVAAIAAEKAGILKAGNAAVTTAVEPARAIITDRAAAAGATLRCLDRDVDWSGFSRGRDGVEIETASGLRVCSPLLGDHQTANLALAVAAAQQLGIPDGAIVAGAAAVRWPGRLQWIDGAPPLLIDAAHNPAGMRAVAAALPQLTGGRRVVAVTAILSDKEAGEMLATLAGACDDIVATAVATERARPAAELVQLAGRGVAVDGVAAALAEAARRAGAAGVVLVCGSLALAGEVLAVRT